MSTDSNALSSVTPPSLQMISSGSDGQALLGRHPSGLPYELRILSGSAATSHRWKVIEEQLNRLRLINHPSIRDVTDLSFDKTPPSFRLALRSHIDPINDRLSVAIPSLTLEERLNLAARIVEATESAHRLGVYHGSFDPSTILVYRTQHALGCQIDFSGTACCQGIEIGVSDVEGDLQLLQELLQVLLTEFLEDGFPVPTTSPIAPRQIAVLRQCLRNEDDLATPIQRWRIGLDGLFSNQENKNSGSSQSSSMLTSTGETSEIDWDHSGPPAPQANIPAKLGRFKLLQKIGAGGMGLVYRATDESNGETVAVKILQRKEDKIVQSIRRFRKETRILAEVQNEFVTRLIDVGEDQGFHFLAMEFIDGIDLNQWLAGRGALPENEALSIALDLSRALVDAHSKSIVHRDIKPENVLLKLRTEAASRECEMRKRPIEEFDIKLTDFGIARHVTQSESMEVTRAGSVLGTPTYMSPEQCKSSDNIGPTTDVYAMGVTLFQLLCGSVPFEAEDFMQLASKHCFNEIPSVQKRNAEVSDLAAGIVRRAMAKDPADRFGDASQLLSAIASIQRGEAADAHGHPKLPDHDPDKVWDKTTQWTLDSTPTQLWPFVSNTERLNEAIGLPAVTYRTQDDHELGLRKFGSFTLSGVKVSWEEHPFEWIEGQRMGILREFDAGPFKWFLSRVTLKTQSDGKTLLSHQVTIEPRNFTGRVLTTIEADWKGFRNLAKVYQRMDRSIQGRLPQNEGVDPFQVIEPLHRDQAKRLDQRIDQLINSGIEQEVALTVHQMLSTSSSQELAQIRPLAIADRFTIDGSKMIDAFLWATKLGLLRLRWDILCPTCRVATLASDQLSEIDTHTHCEACDLDFKSNLGDAIEMVFEAHPEIRTINDGQYCIGGPEHSPHVIAQQRISPGERLETQLDLGPGDYLIRSPRLTGTQPIHVQDASAPSTIEVALSELGKSHHTPKLRAGTQRLTILNDLGFLHVVRVERMIPRDDVVTATRASANPLFRKLFPHQQFATDTPIESDMMAFLSTCINNTESLYAGLGDAQAYSLIHSHHEALSSAVLASSGAIVKTIGERMLACFQRQEDAIDACYRIRTFFDELDIEPQECPLVLGIGIHSGPTLVTTQNNQLDYFGSTVRAVSALPELADNETLVSESVYTDPVCIEKLHHLSDQVETMDVPGTPGLRVRRITTTAVS